MFGQDPLRDLLCTLWFKAYKSDEAIMMALC